MPKHPERAPVRPPVWNPNESRYWDARDLEDELRRTFQICHECRMCVTYCGAFPILFDAVDEEIGSERAEGSETVGAAAFAEVSDHCWQCKLCYIKCPYTADEGAYELLDFPRLMAREKAQRARRDGIPLVDRLLGEPQAIGAVSSGAIAPLANLINRQRLLRKVTEKVTGISAEFPLPPLARTTFHEWFSRHEPLEGAGRAGQVALFPTCYGEFNFPEVARAAVRVLEKNGYSVVLPDGLTCCGMPNIDGGDVDGATAKMRHNVEVLLPLVRRGMNIVVPGPTCGYTMKHEWPTYVGSAEAADVALATRDLMQFLDGLRREKKLVREFVRGYGNVAYHAACHLRAQKIAIPGARVLSQLPDTEVRIIERCSAVDGTWGMKARFYDEGARYAQKLVNALNAAEEEGAEMIVSDCNLAALRIFKGTGKTALHPIIALERAYGLGDESVSAAPPPPDARLVASHQTQPKRHSQ
jgi:glycerol-3-phosphate dehydrogenase subunit C